MTSSSKSSKAITILGGTVALLLTITIIKYPDTAFDASLHGLKVWFDVVLPALLPFFAMAEIMIGLGVVHFIGVLVEPLMIPIFRIPGTGAFAVAMGLASGYPVGAKITGRLRREGLCNQVEGERLVSFANTADPLFMIGAVAVGMFGMQQLGHTLATAHYISAIMVGFLMRFHGSRSKLPPTQTKRVPGGNIFARALRAMHRARVADGRPFGQLFADAVNDTLRSMLFIGGCIMMFSVFIRTLTEAGAIDWLAALISRTLSLISLNQALVPSLLRGLFEITIGCQASSQAVAPLLHKAMAASAVIAWSGFSVHTQVAAMIHGTDIRLFPYICARFVHGVLAAIVTYLIVALNPTALETASTLGTPAAITTPSFLGRLTLACATTGKILIVLGALIALSLLWRKISVVVFRVRR